MPHTDVMVTNAGYSGVPFVCVGDSEDKAEVSARVA